MFRVIVGMLVFVGSLQLAQAKEPAADIKVPKAVHRALAGYMGASKRAKEKAAFKKVLKLLGGDLALTAEALRTLPPLTKARPGTKHGETFESGGQAWEYSIHLPKGYDGKQRFPVLVLSDHGSVGPEAGINFWVGKVAAENYVLFRPVIVKFQSDRTRFRDQQFFARDQAIAVVMRDALRHLRLHYAVDSDRFSMTGLSQAGFYTWYYALSYPDSFAAIVPESAGGMALIAQKVLAPNVRGMQIRILHHPDDQITPYAHAKLMKEAIGGERVELITYKDSDYPGTPFPKRHPGPHNLRIMNVLPWAHGQARTLSPSITRVVRYAQQGLEGQWRVTPPSKPSKLFTVTCESNEGVLSSNHKRVWYRVSPGEVLAGTVFTIGSKIVEPKADLTLLLESFKASGDRGRLVAAEIRVR